MPNSSYWPCGSDRGAEALDPVVVVAEDHAQVRRGGETGLAGRSHSHHAGVGGDQLVLAASSRRSGRPPALVARQRDVAGALLTRQFGHAHQQGHLAAEGELRQD